MLRWHRDLVRRKWALRRSRAAGRPSLAADLEALVRRLAAENGRWGYSRIHGELRKLGHTIRRSAVRDALKRRGVPPAPRRGPRGESRRTVLARHGDQVLVCDFFTVETLFLETLYALFFLEVGTRRVRPAGCTARSTTARVTEQARNLTWTLHEDGQPVRYIIHDRDAQFPATFDAVFATEGMAVVRTPYRAPHANAFAERWVRSAREECVDHLLIASEAHLRRVPTAYAAYFDEARPHRGRDQCVPPAPIPRRQADPVRRRDALGGLRHDYHREAA